MTITEQNILDVELSINTLVGQKDLLVLTKKEYELEMSILKNKLRSGGRMNDSTYKSICDKQDKLKRNILSIERSMSELNTEILNKSGLKEKLRLEFKKTEGINIKSELIVMRDFYINFASDNSRVSSMRAMAAEFSKQLEVLIKSC